jgi:hypothetical protein
MRGWVCNLWMLLDFTSILCLGYKSCRTHDHNLLSKLVGAGFCIYYPRNKVAQFNFQAKNLINLHVII